MLRTDTLAAARSGDSTAFSELTEPYRHELQVHCYRILGSLLDAEDMVQETFLRAWRRLETFEGRASFRAWLYKIATNVCLDALDKHPRRVLPPNSHPSTNPEEPFTPPLADPIWLEPLPDAWLAPSPEARFTARESITLAFLAALQHLPPRQRAVLLLCDVLDWRARETADLLDMTVSAVNSTLHRARATMSSHYAAPTKPEDKALQARLDVFVQAWESADVATLVTILKEDAAASMPPSPSWYRGREAIGHFLATQIFVGGRRDLWRVQRTRANNHPAFGLYVLDNSTGMYHARGIQVLIFEGTQVAEIIHFMTPQLFSRFGLPDELS